MATGTQNHVLVISEFVFLFLHIRLHEMIPEEDLNEEEELPD